MQSLKKMHVCSAPFLEVSQSQEQWGLSSHLFRVSEFGSSCICREKGAFLTDDLGWVVGEWVSLLRMSWPCISNIIFSWLQWLTQILLWEGITSQCSGFGRKAKEKKLQNEGFYITPAVRIPSTDCWIHCLKERLAQVITSHLALWAFLSLPSTLNWDTQQPRGKYLLWSWDLSPNDCRRLGPSDRWDSSFLMYKCKHQPQWLMLWG